MGRRCARGLSATLTIIGVLVGSLWSSMIRAEPVSAIAAHGDVRHNPAAPQFSYVNPDAPKGGTLHLAITGSFQGQNPFSLTASAPAGLRTHVFESLMTRAFDEPFSLYGLLAESVEVPDDRSWVQFRLRANARFQDGSPVRAEDVRAAFAYLKANGKANHRTFYRKVAKFTIVDDRSVRMDFAAGGDRELPMIMALMPIFKRVGAAFVGTGPYRLDRAEPGRSVSYRRDRDYWGWDLSVNRGRHNFDHIRYDYYRDATAAFEAFRAGQANFRIEANAGRWARDYQFTDVPNSGLAKAEVAHELPSGMYGFVFNSRRPMFSDVRVRSALAMVFDGAWVNRTLYGNAYRRTRSYFDNSALATDGEATGAERKLLESVGVDQNVIIRDPRLAKSVGDGRNRAARKAALLGLAEAGYRFRDGRLIGPVGRPFSFEILTRSREEERLALTLKDALLGLGIEVTVGQVDSARYQARLNAFDFDMILYRWAMSLSPGNEQYHYWSRDAAKRKGSRNYAGVRSAEIDRVIDALVAADSRVDLIGAARALDRLLLAGRYVIPLFHSAEDRIVWRAPLSGPSVPSLYGFRLDAWWSEPTR